MQKVPGTQWKALLPFLSREREFNMFIIGDIENTTPDAQHMEVFVDGDIQDPKGVLLRYYKFFVLSSSESMEYSQAAKIIRDFEGAMIISGAVRSIDMISPFLLDITEEEDLMYFASLREPSLLETDLPIRRASMKDARKLLNLLSTIEEFHATEEESFMTTLEDGSTRRYIVEDGDKIICTAASTAESSDMAMIIGVATHKDYRNRGLASAVVSKLCSDLLSEGKTPCLFYDNPNAGKIYNRLGFKVIGKWKMLRFKR